MRSKGFFFGGAGSNFAPAGLPASVPDLRARSFGLRDFLGSLSLRGLFVGTPLFHFAEDASCAFYPSS